MSIVPMMNNIVLLGSCLAPFVSGCQDLDSVGSDNEGGGGCGGGGACSCNYRWFIAGCGSSGGGGSSGRFGGCRSIRCKCRI
ncbi:hypothetical protein DERP_004889 [Dermatophagoides pteronyssinus]|uniref:Uncharacterized protein n=1 Tax=Dermatophagoides pteronyssinus TaxID=6956 RepID=A0ABQ8JTD7_DERPT|nr:hypothetical protein DERP_004889 [Dermatophagoides pteronyssinus]